MYNFFKRSKRLNCKETIIKFSPTNSTYNSLVLEEDIRSIENIINKHRINSSVIDNNGISLLHLAALHNKPEICEFLLNMGVPVDIEEKFSGKKAAHIAAFFGNIECLKLLLEYEGKKRRRKRLYDFLYCLPVHYAVLGGSKKAIDLFFGEKDFFSRISCLGNPLDILIRKGNHELLKFVCDNCDAEVVEPFKKENINIENEMLNPIFWTPFHSASASDDINSLEILKNSFPNASALCKKDLDGISPGYVAILEGNTKAATFFSDYRSTNLLRNNLKDNWVFTDGATHHSAKLFEIIMDRNHIVLNDFLAEHKMEIFVESAFRPLKTNLFSHEKFNAINLACNGFCFSFFNFLSKQDVVFDLDQYVLRDNREILFFNWATMPNNPLAEGFFIGMQEYFNFRKGTSVKDD